MISITDPCIHEQSRTGWCSKRPCSRAIGSKLAAARLLLVTNGILSPLGIIAPIRFQACAAGFHTCQAKHRPGSA